MDGKGGDVDVVVGAVGLSDGVIEGRVGVVGVDAGASVAAGNGVSWVGNDVTDAFGLQANSIVNVKNNATKMPCFMIASGLFAVSYTR